MRRIQGLLCGGILLSVTAVVAGVLMLMWALEGRTSTARCRPVALCRSCSPRGVCVVALDQHCVNLTADGTFQRAPSCTWDVPVGLTLLVAGFVVMLGSSVACCCLPDPVQETVTGTFLTPGPGSYAMETLSVTPLV